LHTNIKYVIETGILIPKPKILGFHMSGPATCPYKPNKRHGEGRERRLINYKVVTCYRKSKVSTQHIFSHL
jgi:hypothetical protein